MISREDVMNTILAIEADTYVIMDMRESPYPEDWSHTHLDDYEKLIGHVMDKLQEDLYAKVDTKDIKTDLRYSVSPEDCGYMLPQYVIRYCGDWIGHERSEVSAWIHADLHRSRREERGLQDGE